MFRFFSRLFSMIVLYRKKCEAPLHLCMDVHPRPFSCSPSVFNVFRFFDLFFFASVCMLIPDLEVSLVSLLFVFFVFVLRVDLDLFFLLLFKPPTVDFFRPLKCTSRVTSNQNQRIQHQTLFDNFHFLVRVRS